MRIRERLEYDLSLRSMPDFIEVLDGLKRNIDEFQQQVGSRLSQEYGIELGLTPADLQAIYENGPREFLERGP
jgi:hypothetical protein